MSTYNHVCNYYADNDDDVDDDHDDGGGDDDDKCCALWQLHASSWWVISENLVSNYTLSCHASAHPYSLLTTHVW